MQCPSFCCFVEEIFRRQQVSSSPIEVETGIQPFALFLGSWYLPPCFWQWLACSHKFLRWSIFQNCSQKVTPVSDHGQLSIKRKKGRQGGMFSWASAQHTWPYPSLGIYIFRFSIKYKSLSEWILHLNQYNLFINIKLPGGIQVSFKTHTLGTSLVVQWLRICLAMQGKWVQSLVRKPRSHVQQRNKASVPQLLRPTWHN